MRKTTLNRFFTLDQFSRNGRKHETWSRRAGTGAIIAVWLLGCARPPDPTGIYVYDTAASGTTKDPGARGGLGIEIDGNHTWGLVNVERSPDWTWTQAGEVLYLRYPKRFQRLLGGPETLNGRVRSAGEGFEERVVKLTDQETRFDFPVYRPELKAYLMRIFVKRRDRN